jgi:hypothetical protein
VVLIYPVNDNSLNYKYQWYRNDTLLTNDTNKYYYNRTENGGIIAGVNYSLHITTDKGCTREIEYIRIPDKSSLFKADDIFTLYPNPNQGTFTLCLNDEQVPENTEELQVKITGTDGKMIFDETLPCEDQPLSLPGVSKGLYLVEIKAGTQFRQVRKLVVY